MSESKRRIKGSHEPPVPLVLVSLLMPKGLAQALDEMAEHAKVERGALILAILAQVVKQTRELASQDTAAAPSIARRGF